MPGSHSNLFAYGTLMAPQIIQRVIGRVPESEPAHVLGFHRFTVQNQNFPGLIRSADPKDRVDGLLYHAITADEWNALDAYEDDFYVLEEIAIHLASSQARARTYLVPPRASHVLNSDPWDFDDFVQHHLRKYLA